MSTSLQELPAPNFSGWEYDTAGELQETSIGKMERRIGGTALALIDAPQGDIDSDMAHAIANEVNTLFDKDREELGESESKIDVELKRLQAGLEQAKTEAQKNRLSAIISSVRGRQKRKPLSLDELSHKPEVVEAVDNELAAREKGALEQRVTERIERDRYPWTMPGSESIPPREMTELERLHQNITAVAEPSDDDYYRIPALMQVGGGYCPADKALFEANGLTVEQAKTNLGFKRGVLKQAGVFFVNSVGDGEQPIFGVPIPDPDSENGIFDPSKRAFLTKDEFEKIYRYQQAHGYGLDGADPADVQTDMVVFAGRPTNEQRNQDLKVLAGGSGGRENKYGLMRSPFVDSGWFVRGAGISAMMAVLDSAGKSARRMNAVTIHLVNGHRDYPGVSEMFDPGSTAWDQKYVSVGDFVQNFYLPPPTKRETLLCLRYGLPTKRERTWLGPSKPPEGR